PRRARHRGALAQASSRNPLRPGPRKHQGHADRPEGRLAAGRFVRPYEFPRTALARAPVTETHGGKPEESGMNQQASAEASSPPVRRRAVLAGMMAAPLVADAAMAQAQARAETAASAIY